MGIPYAKQEVVGRRVYAICPTCGAKIELKVRKDAESRSGAEYAAHHKANHEVQKPPPAA